MPSLRERREEIPMMLRHFMIHLADRYACAPLQVSPRLVDACEALLLDEGRQMLRDCLAAISFALQGDPRDYDPSAEALTLDVTVAPAA